MISYNKQSTLKLLLSLLCFHISSSFVLNKRQSDLYATNNFDASFLENSESNNGGSVASNGGRSTSYSSMSSNSLASGGGDSGRGMGSPYGGGHDNSMSGSGNSGRGMGSSNGGGNGNSMGSGINPFNSNSNTGGMGPFSGGSKGNGGGMGPFSGGSKGNGGGMGPFAGGAANGNGGGSSNSMGGGMDPFNSNSNGGQSSTGPFTGGASGNSAGPFSSGSKGSSMGPFQSNDKDNGMKTPFDSSNMNGGPGGMVGGRFNLDIGTNDGPGGLNGSPFMTNNDGGPGGLSGGSFMQKTDSSTTDSKFDTSQYEQMLKEMFATDSGAKSEGSPFDPDSYSGNINAANTGRTNLNSAGSGQSQGYGNTDSAQSQGYGNTDSAHGSYESGIKESRYQFNNGNTDTYQTPFNEKTDYNELLSTPFQSNNNNGRAGSQSYKDQSLGTGYSPFKSDRGMPGMARMNNPGGNPFSQGGSQIGRG
ncbi:loricrin-like isoform X2 [Mytilus californianus]|uniref:loricrin-like isoform X2 n=1 Tax=Mytilus californianus TaxID=6549 RepID=UPI002246F017|nr:loricrin-like isoform X2 [Mytilus californianus]